MSYLDSLFYFKDLWNWVGYQYFFTVWTYASHPFQAKKQMVDPVYDFKAMVEKRNQDKVQFQLEIKNIIQNFRIFELVDFKNLDLKKSVLDLSLNSYDEAYPAQYRSNIFCVVRYSIENPKHYANLPAIYKKSYYILQNGTKKMIESEGYHALILQGFTSKDYADSQHMLASGGRKTAIQVASRIKKFANKNDYSANT
jgi:hypothetical protein